MEMLFAAGKAAGYTLEARDGRVLRTQDGVTAVWNPLEDDGDAFRLMVDCEIDVEYVGATVEASVWTGGAESSFLRATEQNGTDKGAATRRAVTRAAAAMSNEEAQD